MTALGEGKIKVTVTVGGNMLCNLQTDLDDTLTYSAHIAVKGIPAAKLPKLVMVILKDAVEAAKWLGHKIVLDSAFRAARKTPA